MKEKIKQLSKEYLSEVISFRRHIHQNPELGFEEYNTTKFIQEQLNNMGLTNHKVALKRTKTGVYVDIDSNKPGKTVLFRADIDALPLEEESNVEYKSNVKGVAHMCGHDGHIASLLGVAKILLQLKDSFKGKVRLLFQPAEEGPDMGGCVEVVNEKEVLNGVDFALGFHVYGAGDFGKAYFKYGPMYASFIDWDIKIKSNGGHCSEPHKSADPIIIGSQAINLFQSILTKIKSPLDNAVLAVGTFNGGSNSNVIPTEATMTGTIRTYDLELGRTIVSKMKSIMNSLCELYNGTYESNFLEGYPPLINNNQLTKFVMNETISLLGKDNVKEIDHPTFGCEDFSYIANEVPSCYFKIGIHKENEIEPLHHSGSFEWDDSVLETSMAVSANAIISFLNAITK